MKSKHRLLSFLLLLVTLLILPMSVVLVAAEAPHRQEEPAPVDAPAVEDGAPVIVNGQELWRVKTRVGSFSPSDRAAAVSERITRIASNPFAVNTTVRVVDAANLTDIVIGDEIIYTVTDTDAAAHGRDRLELAKERAAAIQTAINESRRSSSIRTLASGVAIGIALIILLAFLMWLIVRTGNWVTGYLDPTLGYAPLPRALRQSEFYLTGQFSRLVRAVLRGIEILLGLLLFTTLVPLILERFPQTRTLGVRLHELIFAPLSQLWDGLVGALPEISFLLVLAVLTWLATRIIKLFFREIERGVIRLPSFEPEWAMFTAKMISMFVIVVAVIIGFTSLPASRLPVFQGVSAFVALLITLSSTSAIANIIAGIILTYTGAFSVGDIVQIQTTLGQVTGKLLLTTRIRTFKNEQVSIPNSLVLNTSITNFSRIARETGLTLHTTVTIGYNTPWEQVHELLLAAARATPRIEAEPPPFVLQTSLNDYHISYELNAFTRAPEFLPRIYSDVHQSIQDQFQAAGVEIMSPVYAALRDGNAVTLPPEFVLQDHRPASLRTAGDAQTAESVADSL